MAVALATLYAGINSHFFNLLVAEDNNLLCLVFCFIFSPPLKQLTIKSIILLALQPGDKRKEVLKDVNAEIEIYFLM